MSVPTPPQTDTYCTALDIYDHTQPLTVDNALRLRVTAILESSSIEIGTVDQGMGGTSPWLVHVDNFPSSQDVVVTNTVTIAGSVNAIQSGAWSVGRTWTLSSGTDSVSVGNFPATQSVTQGTTPWIVNGSGFTQPVSGTVTTTQGTSPWVTSVSNFPATVAVTQSTSPWVVSGTVTANAGTGTFLVDGSAHTQPVSGTVTANQGTSPWVVSGTITTSPNVNVHDGTGVSISSTGSSLNTNVTNTVTITGSVNAIQSGAWSVGRTWTLSSATDSVNVGNFPATQPVSGTVAVTQSTSPWVTSGSGNFTVVQPTGTNLHTVLDSGTLTSITNALPAGTNVIGHVITDTGSTTVVTGTVAVTGPLTDTQLRASPVPVSLTSTTVTGNVTVVQPTGTNLHVVVDSAPTTAVTQSTSPWVVSGTVAATQSGTWTVQPGNTANTTPWLTTINQGGNSAAVTAANALKVDGSAVTQPVSGTVTANQGTSPWVISGTVAQGFPTGATYASGVGPFTPPATPTDMTTITGSATKTIRVLSFELTPVQTTRNLSPFYMIKRSTANTAGTSATTTVVPLDSNFAAGTGVVRQYTANPTLGTTVGAVTIVRVLSDDSGANAVGGGGYFFDFTKGGTAPGVILRGTSQVLALNYNGAALAVGLSIVGTWTWVEE